MAINQTLKIENGRLVPSADPYDAALLEVSKEVGNAIIVKDDGLFVALPSGDGGETVIDPELASKLAQFETNDTQHASKIAALEASDLEHDTLLSELNTAATTAATDITSLKTKDVEQDALVLDIVTDLTTAKSNITDITSKNVQQQEAIDNLSNQIKPVIASTSPGNISTVTATESGFEVFTPSIVDEVSTASTAPTNLENSLPIYTLGNGGEYVLCQPDNWIKIGDNYIPSYSATTIGK